MNNISIPKIAILGVGSELTSGQTQNTNASWLSDQLTKLGLQCHLHLVVPDEENLILKALDWAQSTSDIIFTTGGLGPTSDDFTRDMLAKKFNKKLEFNTESLEHIQSRLQARGIVLVEAHKKQCYFPQGARILQNSQGSAHGFEFTENKTKIICLPGPPKEIQAIWKDHLLRDFSSLSLKIDAFMTKSWDVLGHPESLVAEHIEPILAKEIPEFIQNKKAIIGYRIHLPYVEVKLSYYASISKDLSTCIDIISKTIENLNLNPSLKK